MKLILKNEFHGTQIIIYTKESYDPREYYEFLIYSKCEKDKSKLKKIQETLCGMDDCSCGTLR